MSHWYTIDDADAQVAYSGSWEVVTGSGHYSGSAHSTAEVGATATLTFKGTGIKVWMSIPTGDWNQISGFRINGDFINRHIECKDVPGYNELTFIREGLGEGPHTIVISQEGTRYSPRGGAPVQLDRIEVLTSPSDPNPAPIYPAGVSPPNTPNPNPPPSTAPTVAPSSNPPSMPNPPSPAQPSSEAPSNPQNSPGQSVPARDVVSTMLVVTSGSSTFTVQTTVPSGQPVITKVIQDRVYTTTDSTGGVAVRTEVVEAGQSGGSGPSTGLLVGVIVAVVLLLLSLVAMGLLFWRRKHRKRRNRKENGSVGEMGQPHADPFALHARGQGPPSSSADNSNPFSTGNHSREVSTTVLSTDVDYAQNDAPPAYRMAEVPAGPLLSGKAPARTRS